MTNRGDDLPNPSTVIRYVGYAKMRKDADDNFHGPSESAFETRPGEEYLSVTWCEFYGGGHSEQLRCAIEAVRNSGVEVKSKACFCIAATEALKSAVAELSERGEARAVYLPEDDNPAHAGIYGISPRERRLLQRLAHHTWSCFLTKDMANELPLTDCNRA